MDRTFCLLLCLSNVIKFYTRMCFLPSLIIVTMLFKLITGISILYSFSYRPSSFCLFIDTVDYKIYFHDQLQEGETDYSVEHFVNDNVYNHSTCVQRFNCLFVKLRGWCNITHNSIAQLSSISDLIIPLCTKTRSVSFSNFLF